MDGEEMKQKVSENYRIQGKSGKAGILEDKYLFYEVSKNVSESHILDTG